MHREAAGSRRTCVRHTGGMYGGRVRGAVTAGEEKVREVLVELAQCVGLRLLIERVRLLSLR